MTKLSFDDNSVDVVTGGYALRNAPDLRVALTEVHRILKPKVSFPLCLGKMCSCLHKSARALHRFSTFLVRRIVFCRTLLSV